MTLDTKKIIMTLIVIYSIITVFHSCILLKIIPYDITWGGRLQNDQEMYVFETTSIAINLFLIWILLMKGDFVTYKFPVKVIHIILWIFVVVFALNTVGNLFAKTLLEKAFTLLTLGSALAIGFVLRRPLS
ncbi:MAG: hypothetical protein LW721_08960 [Flammeovirgaceae bacterium]|jgi:hypothetical protein|nr:hypothetical protein [Flammeovirgaceae bacterium]